MARRPRTRWLILGLIAAILAGALYASFREQPVSVDLGTVARGPMAVEIASDARTRVAETYVISAPVAGQLRRVTLHAGDAVRQGETVLAHISPALPAFLDARSRAQAQAAVDEAEAALRAAEADREAARAESDLARSALQRTQRLAISGTVSPAAVENARAAAEAAEARFATAEAAIAMRHAAVISARTLLDQNRNGNGNGNGMVPDIDITAPVSGTVLHIMAQSETTIAAGTPIMEIGDIGGDLEVVSDILSRDAVRIAPGQRVRISDWGGDADLDAVVLRVDPMAMTRVSALGVEEQRVNVVIGFTGPAEARAGLGHGFQLDTHIIVWETPDALLVPSAALIRGTGGWSAFVQTETGRAERRALRIGANNGSEAEVLEGLAEGEQVVLYPTASITDGTLLTRRAVPS